MKKIILALALLLTSLANAQAFKGKDDNKAQVGANIQKGGTGIFVSYDYGIGENMSIGATTNFLLGGQKDVAASDLDFKDRFDLKARFNANLGSVLDIDKKLDIYPGLDLGLKNFGAHLGARYFFTDGFGVFTEFGLPLAKYNKNDNDYNNQFVWNFGASFNL